MSSLGDIIHTLPALSDAAQALSSIRFDWVVEEAFQEIPSWHPAVEKVIPIALRRWRKHPLRDFTGPEWKQCRQSLRAQHYDAIVDAQGLLKSAFVARLARAPIYGMDKQSAREPVATLAYHHKINVRREMHAVERIRCLFAQALGYTMPEQRGEYGLRGNLPPGAQDLPPGLLFFHGTARDEKLWPEAHWVALAERVTAAGYTAWMPWGNAQERERAERVAAAVEGVKVLPRLDLLGIAGMLLDVQAAVAVDTGLAHLGAALDVPTVSLYGPTDTRLIGAYGSNQVHIQSPMGVANTDDPEQMMASITPDRVWQELSAILPGDA